MAVTYTLKETFTGKRTQVMPDPDNEGKTLTTEISVRDIVVEFAKDGKKYNYICPRFWCLSDEQGKQRSLTLEQINNGECGGWKALIDEKAKVVPKNGRIVEFTDERFHREQSGVSSLSGDKKDLVSKLLYRPMYPGFQGPEKHKDGLCIPCCFQTPFKKQENIPQIFKDKQIERE